MAEHIIAKEKRTTAVNVKVDNDNNDNNDNDNDDNNDAQKHIVSSDTEEEATISRVDSEMGDGLGVGALDALAGVTSKRLGKCKWFNVAKGWGFITPNDGSQDIFVHQSVIKMSGFRSLADNEEVEFECKNSDKGLEATRVSGPSLSDCHGSNFRPSTKKRFRKIRCYNCGEFANHIALKCALGPQPKRCHHCKGDDHLIADCPSKPAESEKSTQSRHTE